MRRILIFVTSFILVSALVGTVYGGIEYKVDLCLNLAPDGEPPVVDEATFKGSEPGCEDVWPPEAGSPTGARRECENSWADSPRFSRRSSKTVLGTAIRALFGR